MKHPVWKLIYKFLLIGIPLYLLMLYTYFFPMNYMAIEYSMWAQQKEYSKSGNAANTLIIGDSRAKSGLMPTLLSEDTYNMAIGGTTSIEMYYALNRYLDHHTAPKNIMIIFAPYHFCDIDNWGQTQYFNYLTTPELLEVYQNALKFDDKVVLAGNPITDMISYKLRLPNKYLSAQYNALFFGRRNDNLSKYQSVEKDLGYSAFGTDKGNDGENYETHHEIFDQSLLVESYYYKLLQLCVDNDIRVFIEQSPVNQASYDLISNDFFDGYHEFLSEVSATYPSISINSEVIAYDNQYFGDNNHLNPDGAKIFTDSIKKKYPEIFSSN
ncbi:MAG: hypothetical protein PHY47_04150 [Lachnospiraceae bacterium]|nr:hypothetical protein [Lachnospiraceae bacterium]